MHPERVPPLAASLEVPIVTLHVDFWNGILEVEGPEEFVRAIYDDFKVRMAAAREGAIPPPGPQPGDKTPPTGSSSGVTGAASPWGKPPAPASGLASSASSGTTSSPYDGLKK